MAGVGFPGRYWYEEQGKYLMKRNTFTDFVACAETLIEEGCVGCHKVRLRARIPQIVPCFWFFIFIF